MPEVSQGSSLLATLGIIAESLWDSRSLASIKIRVRRRASEARRRLGFQRQSLSVCLNSARLAPGVVRLPPALQSRNFLQQRSRGLAGHEGDDDNSAPRLLDGPAFILVQRVQGVIAPFHIDVRLRRAQEV